MTRLFPVRGAFVASLFVLALSAAPASAQATFTWTGNGVDSNWSNEFNWTGGGPGNPTNGTNVILAGNNQLANNQNLNFSPNSLTINSTAGAFVVGGAGTMTIGAGGLTNNDNNSIQTINSNLTAGAAQSWTVVSGGILNLGGTVTIGANLLTMAGAGNITKTGGAMNIGSGGLTVTNTGTVTLNGAITMTAATAITKNGAGTLAVGGTVNNATFLLSVGGTGDSTYSGAISGTGGLAKNGTGTVTLTAVNTYGGATTVDAGVLRFDSIGSVAGAGANVTVNSTGTAAAGFAIDQTFLGRIVPASAGVIALAVDSANPLDMTGFTTARLGAVGTAALSGTLTPNGTTYLLGGGGGTLTISSVLADNGGATGVDVGLNGTPAGRVVLSGVNTYTGATTVNGGVLQFEAATAIGGAGASVLVNGGGRVAAGYAIDQAFINRINPTSTGLVLLAVDSGNALDLSGTGANLAGVHIGALGSATYSGTLTPNGTTYRLGGSGILTVSSVLSGANSLDAGRIGESGTVILTGANTFTGGITINGGNLRIGAANTLNGNAVTFASGSTGVLQLNGINTTIGGLSNTGTEGIVENLNAAAATATLTVDQAIGSSTFGGVIRNGDAAAVLGLTKAGAGTFTLGGANTYTGDTTVSAGVLAVTNATALGATAGNTTVDGGAALQVSGGITIAEPLVLNGSGIGNSGALRSISGNNVMSGAFTVASSTRINADAGLLTIFGAIGAGGNVLGIGGAGNTTISGVITMSGTLVHDSASVLTLTANNAALTGPIQLFSGGILSYADQTSLGITGLVTLNNGTLRNTNPAAGAFIAASRDIDLGAGGGTLEVTTAGIVSTINAGTTISGAGSLTKAGAGIIALAEPATYTGATNVVAGTLRAGAAGVFSSASAVTLADAAGASLDLNGFNQTIAALAGGGAAGGNVTLGSGILTVGNSASTTFAGVASGTGGLTKVGTGTLTLGGVNTYTGATTINAGTLQAGAAGVFSSASAVTLADAAGATLDLNNSNQTIAALAGGGAAGGNVSLGSATLTVGGNNASTTFAGVASGAGGLTKAGTGTLALNGANAYTGTTTVNAGTLAGTGSLSGAVTVNGGASIRGGVAGGTGTLTVANSPVTLNNGGILNVEISRNAPNDATSSLLNLTGTSVLNLAPTAGNKFHIEIDGGTNPMVTGETYTVTLVSVASGTINVNGTLVPDGGVIPESAYTFNLYPFFTHANSPSLARSGGNLTFTFTPVPEPATVLGIAVAALGLAGLTRRRLVRA